MESAEVFFLEQAATYLHQDPWLQSLSRYISRRLGVWGCWGRSTPGNMRAGLVGSAVVLRTDAHTWGAPGTSRLQVATWGHRQGDLINYGPALGRAGLPSQGCGPREKVRPVFTRKFCSWGAGTGHLLQLPNKADTEPPDDRHAIPATCPRDLDTGVQAEALRAGLCSPVLGGQKVETTSVSADGPMEQPAGLRPPRGRALGPEKGAHGPPGRYASCGVARVTSVGQAGTRGRGGGCPGGRGPRAGGERTFARPCERSGTSDPHAST